eukprot:CAMPEP_0169139012 /NCGR_PEP_ID=MMETSP1015-20121227/42686_1 /TAXON_ID=342587 /ORGANISM="Karlodinium micrum, Strain CCMP2283" /LENGTH=101 /DNA_ID=CAMNT_0009204577 /DNA_START=63 /DNA_END=368 /DNA_ORIENTATION=+
MGKKAAPPRATADDEFSLNDSQKRTKAGKRKGGNAIESSVPPAREQRKSRPSFLDPKVALLALIGVTCMNLWRYFNRVRAPVVAPEVERGGHALDLSGDDD